MNRTFKKLGLLAATVFLGVQAFAAYVVVNPSAAPTMMPDPNGYAYGFSVTGVQLAWSTASTTYTNSFAVISPYTTAPQKSAAINYWNVQGDAAASGLSFYWLWNQVAINGVSSTVSGTTTYTAWMNTNNLGVGSQCLIRHVANDSYDLAVVGAVTTGTGNSYQSVSTNGLTFMNSSLRTLNAGDIVWLLQANGTIPIGVSTNTWTGHGPAYVGQPGMPVLMQLNGTAAESINVVSGTYQ